MENPSAKPGLGIKFQFSFFILAALLAFGRISAPLLLAEWLVVVTLSVLAHELGHALAFRRYGHGSHITLHGMGGATQSTGGPRLSHLQDAFVSVSGPMAGFSVALVVFAVSQALPKFAGIAMPDRLFYDLLWVNVGWSIINLLPILPMDGGHIMQSVLRHRIGAKAEVPALVISLAVALACGAGAYAAGWTWSLIMVAWFAASNGQALIGIKRHQRLAGVRTVMREAVEAYYAKNLHRAGSLATDALGQTQDAEAKAQLRLFVLAVETAAGAGPRHGEDPKMTALRASPEWTAALQAARAAQAHDPTKIFK